MTDTPVTNTAPSTPSIPESSSEPVAAPVGAKPYDDDVFDAYTDDAPEAETAAPAVEEEEAEEAEVDPETETKVEDAKATKNDKVDDGFEEVAIKRLINGKDVQFKVKDAIQAYVKQEEFNRNMDRRITHISQREQAWEKDQQSFKGNLSKLIQVAQGGDFITAVKGLAKIATHGTNLDPTTFEKQYFEQLDKVRDVYTKMTPEQREAYFTKRSLAEARQRAAELEEVQNFSAEKSQLQEKVQTLQQQYGLPEAEFWGNYQILSNELVQRGVVASADEIQPEHVVNYSLEVRRQTKVFEAAKKAGLEDEAQIEELGRVTALDPSLTVDEIVQVIKSANLVSVAPNSAVENLNRKAGKSQSQFSKASSTKKDDRINGYDEEDIEFLYRNQPKGYARKAMR